MSSPDPDGAGALKSMADALAAAGLTPKDIDHIVLHGTGTKLNDKIEDIAISKLFGTSTSCGSTKGWTGHTLGAAGILAALTALFCLRSNTLPRNLNLETVDPEFSSNFRLDSVHADVAHVMTNAFGFGGSNCSIIFGRAS